MTSSVSNKSPPSNSTNTVNNNDLLDLLGSLDLSAPTSTSTLPQAQTPLQIFSPTNTTNFLVDGLLNSSSIQNGLCNLIKYLFLTANIIQISFYFITLDTLSMIVLDKAGLKITFKLERPPDIADLLIINMSAQNSGSAILTDFLFQAAVPKVVVNFVLQLLNIKNHGDYFLCIII